MTTKIKLYHSENTECWTKKVFDNIDYDRCDNVEQADYILVPRPFISNYHNQNLAWLKNIYQKSIDINKPYIAFLHDDPTDEMTENGINYTSNGILFRTSFYKSKASKTEYALPSFYKESEVPFLPVQTKDILVGFCGAITHSIRNECISILNNHADIQAKFHIRNRFHLRYSKDEQDINEKEFIQTIGACQYQLCLRGAGNFSHRFYETLMYGRIPVLVDTDIPLPCEGAFDWNDYIVMAKTVEELPCKLIDWHTKNDIVQKQIEARELWEKYLSPKGFAKYVEGRLEFEKIKKYINY